MHGPQNPGIRIDCELAFLLQVFGVDCWGSTPISQVEAVFGDRIQEIALKQLCLM